MCLYIYIYVDFLTIIGKCFFTIYFVAVNYAIARQKLKQAEELSDLDSNTEKEEYLKRSRKVRAAKSLDTSMSNEEISNDSFISELSKVPQTFNMNRYDKKSNKTAQKSKNIIKTLINQKINK